MKRLVAWLVLILTACSYEFSEERNFVVVDRTKTNDLVTIDLDQVGDDTLLIAQPVNIKYSITGITPDKVRNIYATLNNTTVATMGSLKGTFLLSPPPNTIGLSQLSIVVSSTSGTGSLADKAGIEGNLYEKKWPVMINTKAPGALKVTSIVRDKGSLKVTWERYPYARFSSYMLTRITANAYETISLFNRDSTTFYDKKFLSGEVKYAVTLNYDGGNNYISGPFTTHTDNSAPQLVSTEFVSGSGVRLTWSRGAYPANIKKFEVRVGEGSYFENNPIVHASQAISDTSVIVPATLGQARYFFVRSTSSLTAPWYDDDDHVIKGTTFRSGESFDPYNQIRFSPVANRFYTLSTADLKLRAYNMSNATLVASVNLVSSSNLMELTPSGNRLVHVFNQQVVVYDATTLAPVFQFQMNTDIEPGDNLFSVAVPSDDRMYLTRTHLVQSGSFLVNKAGILVYDLNTGAHVQSILDGPLPPVGQFAYSAGQSRLTANNLMVYEGVMGTIVGAISKIEGDIVTETEYILAPRPDPTNGNQILTAQYNGNKIGVYDWPTRSYVHVINTLSDFTPTDFIPERNIVVGYRSGQVATVFDYATQQTIFFIQAYGFPLSLSGDYLYSSSGVRIKIN